MTWKMPGNIKKSVNVLGYAQAHAEQDRLKRLRKQIDAALKGSATKQQ